MLATGWLTIRGVPQDLRWYIAEFVEKIEIQNKSQKLIHLNMVLVQAISAEDAYEKAIVLGQERQTFYENMEGKLITVTFQGLRDLNVIHTELAHGAELVGTEEVGLTDEEINQMVPSKEQLSVFCPPTMDGPNYIPKDVAVELEKYFGKEWLQII